MREHTADLRSHRELPARVKDKFLRRAIENAGRCLYCGGDELAPIPDGGHRLGLVFCSRHARWAAAARRERIGKQARALKSLLLAYCRLNNLDPSPFKEWLGF